MEYDPRLARLSRGYHLRYNGLVSLPFLAADGEYVDRVFARNRVEQGLEFVSSSGECLVSDHELERNLCSQHRAV